MLEAIARKKRVTHPTPESLIPFALGTDDPATARHVEACATCQTEIERLRETAGLLRGPASLERRIETPDCLDELVLADFVEGRLDPQTRAPVVAHLLTCARCRSVVRATGRLLADSAVARELPSPKWAPAGRGWRRWSLPLGVAAAAALLVILWPEGGGDRGPTPGLREPTDTGTVAPVPIAPRASVARVDRLVWSSVARAERYRLRLYDNEGGVLWTLETSDTLVVLPDSVVLAPRVTYFWKVEAQMEWRRWAASDLVEFRLVGPSR